MKRSTQPKATIVERTYPGRPGWKFSLIVPPRTRASANRLLRPIARNVASTKVVSLLSPTLLQPKHGAGQTMTDVRGYRMANVYLLCEPICTSGERGCSMQVEFALDATTTGVPAGTSAFLNLDGYGDPADQEHRLIHCNSSDLCVDGYLPWYGGVNLCHILRVPIMGPSQ